MDIVLDAIVAFAAWLIYGTEDRPRHPALRYAVRAVGLGGTIALTGAILGLVPMHPVLVLLSPVIFLCLLIVFSAEYRYRRPPWALAAGIVGVGLLLAAISAGL